MDPNSIIGNLLKGFLTKFVGSNVKLPQISSVTNSLNNSSEGSVTVDWENLNSSSLLVIITVLGALALNYRCYGKEKGFWIDRCIGNQILFLIVLSLLFNVESKVIPSSASVTGTSGTDITNETALEPASTEGASGDTTTPSGTTSGDTSGTSSSGNSTTITATGNNSNITSVEASEISTIGIQYNNYYQEQKS